jgi:hypothetical protein
MAKSVNYLINLRDRFSSNISKANASLSKFQKNIDKTKNRISGLVVAQKKLASAAKKSFLGFTAPVTAGLFGSLKLWDKQAKAVAQVEAGIKATGGTAGRNIEQLKRQASDLQSKTLFGDETILKSVTAQLLTFTNIIGENFDEAQVAVVNLASKLGMEDPISASLMLGKALNDPISNLGALSRAGIQFSEDQKQVIKGLAKSGKLGVAQSIILKELQKQYGGAAEAAAKAGIGPLQQAMNQLGDTFELVGNLFGEMIMPHIPRLKEFLTNTMLWINENKSLVKVLLKVSLALAMLAPFLFFLASLAKAFIALKIAATLFSIPLAKILIITSIAIAVGVLIKKLVDLAGGFDNIKRAVKETFSSIKNDVSEFLNSSIQWVSNFFSKVKEFISNYYNFLFGLIGNIANKVGGIINKFKSLNPFASKINQTQVSKIIQNQVVSQQSSVDVRGMIEVNAGKGAQVEKARMFNPNIGLNVATAGG